LTGAFITYGIGQLVSGFLGDKIQPKKLIAMGLATTSVMNLLIPLCQNPLQMTIVWCLNGFSQSFMWPPIVKILFTSLNREDYSNGCVKVSWGSSIGNIFVYLTAPLIIMLLGWKSVFMVSSAMGILGLIFWVKLCPNIQLTPRKKAGKTAGISGSFVFFVTLALVMFGIILQGILKDGITTWMPSYISETYGIRNEISILSGVLLPMFSVLCYSLFNALYLKLKNALLCSGLIFTISTIICALLYTFSDSNAILSIAFSAIITGCMHGVNLMLIGIAPTIFAKNGNVSTFSGILNGTAYVGSAISSWVIPLVTENAGWKSTLLMWLAFSAAGIAVCVACIRLWKKLEKA
jgi:OPA family glycerol-3-phosphate transporter-like MFS transporter